LRNNECEGEITENIYYKKENTRRKKREGRKIKEREKKYEEKPSHTILCFFFP
jgi:hypothetical protein